MKIFRQSNPLSAAAEAGEALNALLLENKKKPVLLMLSAGSALSILEYVGPTALGENLTVSMLDERYSTDAKVNNFQQLQKTDFYTDAFEAEASFFGTLPRPDDTMEILAARWENNLKAWVAENPDGIIVATLGLGADGHTAGIFPYPEDPDKFKKIFANDVWVAAYDAVGKHQYSKRITATPEFFKRIGFGIGYVCGQDKKSAFEKLSSGDKNLAAFPAAVWREIKNLRVFTDIR